MGTRVGEILGYLRYATVTTHVSRVLTSHTCSPLAAEVDIGLAFALIGVFWGDPGTGGRSRLRRIAWTPSAVREAEILAQGIAKSR